MIVRPPALFPNQEATVTRSARWIPLLLVASLVLALLLSAGRATAARDPLPGKIDRTILATWKCQRDLEAPRSEKKRSPWKLGHHSPGFKRAELRRWQARWRTCTYALHRRVQVQTQVEAGIGRYYRAQRLSRGPLTGQGATIEKAARRYGLSPFFLVATSITESSAGLAACRSNHFNIWGLSSCGSGWYVPAFTSWAQAFDFYGRFLTGRTSVTRGWPSARTPYDFRGYAKCSSCWGRKTSEHMAQFFHVGNSVRYPA